MKRQDNTGSAVGVALLMAAVMIGMVVFIFSITGGRGPSVASEVTAPPLPVHGVDRQKVSTSSGSNFRPERSQ